MLRMKAGKAGSRLPVACPIWVKTRDVAQSLGCPRYPRKQTSVSAIEMSAKGQKATLPSVVSTKERLPHTAPSPKFNPDSTPRGADAIRAAGDFDLAGDLQVLAVEADDGERVIHHALCQQRLAVVVPRDALPPFPHLDFCPFRSPRSVNTD